MAYIDLHLSVQTVVQKQIVCHSNSMRLHWMTLSIVIVANVTWGANRQHKCNLFFQLHHLLTAIFHIFILYTERALLLFTIIVVAHMTLSSRVDSSHCAVLKRSQRSIDRS